MLDQPGKNIIFKAENALTGKIFYFFGAIHTNNPADEQFEQLEQLWNDFSNKSEGLMIAFVEGAIYEIPQNYEKSITQYGETGAVCWLALKTNIEVVRPEPGEGEQRKHLSGLFDSNDVAYAIITQNLSGWFRHETSTSFEEAMERVLKREAKFSDIYGFIPNKIWLENQHRKLFEEQELEDRNFLDTITDPRKNDTLINKIVSARSEMRDEHIFNEIEKAWKSGKNIFIVYGKGHLSKLEKKLKVLISGNEI